MQLERFAEGGRTGIMDNIPRFSLPDTSDLPGYGAKDAIIINMVKANQILRDENMGYRDFFYSIQKRLSDDHSELVRLRSENRRLKRLKYKPGMKPKAKKAKRRG